MKRVQGLHLLFAIALSAVDTFGEVALTPTMSSYAEENVSNDTLPLCKFKVCNESKRFFHIQYQESNPAFVKFKLRIIGTSVVESRRGIATSLVLDLLDQALKISVPQVVY
ncbi:hypothetical protein DPMN_173343 [Dreissena polymorpha]|uniref:Uncharacterized protein n=1 Tax=Dreissena polymorpha TaxID=45954 RepID=A0A9D4IGV0_DREPO|nr:hypothetical protein DPMN_173343 [Dreissena polymorpha]